MTVAMAGFITVGCFSVVPFPGSLFTLTGASMRLRTFSATFLIAALASGIAFQARAQAEGSGGPGPQGPGVNRKPPPEAFDTCFRKNKGDSCSYTNRDNVVVTGTCTPPPPGTAISGPGMNASPTITTRIGAKSDVNGGQGNLACRPERGNPGDQPKG